MTIKMVVRVKQQKWNGHVKLDVINLRGNKLEQPVSCIVLNSICYINFHWVIFVHFIVSKTFEINICPTLYVCPTFADSLLCDSLVVVFDSLVHVNPGVHSFLLEHSTIQKKFYPLIHSTISK